MKTTLNIKQFYKELGKLLYAVAMFDKKIQKSEVNAMHEFVSKELALSEFSSDSSGMNLAFYTDFEFEQCADRNISIEDAHDSFMKFLRANVMDIDSELIGKSIRAIENIAGSSGEITEKEREMVDLIKKEILETTVLF